MRGPEAASARPWVTLSLGGRRSRRRRSEIVLHVFSAYEPPAGQGIDKGCLHDQIGMRRRHLERAVKGVGIEKGGAKPATPRFFQRVIPCLKQIILRERQIEQFEGETARCFQRLSVIIGWININAQCALADVALLSADKPRSAGEGQTVCRKKLVQ